MTARTIPRLYLVGPLGAVTAESFVEIAMAAARGGCDAVHLRLPGARTAELLPLARELRARLPDAVLFINDRPDIARIVGFGGVQLPEEGFTPTETRQIAGNDVLVGRSIHDAIGARCAKADGADFVLAGHIFDTDSKAGTPGRGLDWLAEIVVATRLPVIAIGGMNVERIPAVLATGAHGIALGRELLLADDPEFIARLARTSIETFTFNGRNTDHAAG